MIWYILAWLFGVVLCGILLLFLYETYKLVDHYDRLEATAEREKIAANRKLQQLQEVSRKINALTIR